jgi:hypothetical protein
VGSRQGTPPPLLLWSSPFFLHNDATESFSFIYLQALGEEERETHREKGYQQLLAKATH